MADRTARVAGSTLGQGSGTGTASLVTGSITPVSGQLMLVWVLSQRAGGGNTPTLTGTNGLSVTWTAVANIASGDVKLTLFRGVPSSGVAGTLTIAFAGQSQDAIAWAATTWTNVNQTTNQGVAQNITGAEPAGTSKALTFGSAPGNNANAVVYGAGSTANTTVSAESGAFSLVTSQADAQGTLGVESMQQSATVRFALAPNGVSFGASGTICAIAVELTAQNPLDLRTSATDIQPGEALAAGALRGVDTAAHTAVGTYRVQAVQDVGAAFAGRTAYGASGPSNYPAGDPAGLSAVDRPTGPSDSGYWPFRSQRDDAVGSPTPPSQRQTGKGVLRGLLVQGAAGALTISVDVRFEAGRGPYPRLIAKANPALGVFADVVATAQAPSPIDRGAAGYRRGGYDWQTLTLDLVLAAAGVVEVWREKRSPGQDLVWWDHLVVTGS